MSRTCVALATLAVSMSGLAVADEAELGPLDPRAPLPSSQVETGLEGYRLFADEPLKDWKDANQEAFEAAVEMGLRGTYANRPPGTAHVGHGFPARAPGSSAPPVAESSDPASGGGHHGVNPNHGKHTK